MDGFLAKVGAIPSICLVNEKIKKKKNNFKLNLKQMILFNFPPFLEQKLITLRLIEHYF